MRLRGCYGRDERYAKQSLKFEDKSLWQWSSSLQHINRDSNRQNGKKRCFKIVEIQVWMDTFPVRCSLLRCIFNYEYQRYLDFRWIFTVNVKATSFWVRWSTVVAEEEFEQDRKRQLTDRLGFVHEQEWICIVLKRWIRLEGHEWLRSGSYRMKLYNGFS